MIRAALARVRAAPARALAQAVGVALAAAMAGAAVTVAFGLASGFERAAARADMPDVIARFDAQEPERVDALVRRLPNLAGRAYRSEFDRVDLGAEGGFSRRGAVELVRGRRGYAVVEGRDVDGTPWEAVVERGVAAAWGLRVGDAIDVGRLGSLRVAGIAISPDNVAFPLAAVPRVYLEAGWVERELGFRERVDKALIWARDPAKVDVLLAQARATTTQLRDLRFLTRAGVRVLVDSAAGVVIALLVALSLVAVAAAGAMLAAGSSADVQRRLATIGIQRAIGASRARVVAEHAAGAALVALAAATVGLAAGALAAGPPAARLLRALNEQPPGAALLGALAATLAAIVALVAAAAAWPAWRATARPPVELLRGGDLAARAGRRRLAGAGFGALGLRLALARRGRAAAAVVVLSVSAAVVALLLGLASLLSALREDPGSVGKRYSLTARLAADAVPAVRALPGVEDAAARWVVRGADSFGLAEPVRLVAFAGDHARFEDPPLAAGRRLRSDAEAEVGVGLAQALGLGLGGTLAVALPSGREARFRVVGTVRALEDSGRVAYVRPARVLAAQPGLPAEVVVRTRPDADRAAVARGLRELGAAPATVGGATARDGSFLATLAALLRTVAAIDVLVCLYALAQALALTARERRPTLSLLRAAGADARTIAATLAAGALALALPAALAGLALEHWLLAPLVAARAAGYADLSARAGAGQALLVVCALVACALLAAAWVARRVVSEPPVAGLRDE